MRNKYILDILNEYEKIQDSNKEIQKEHQREIYEKFPKIKEIDNKIAHMGFEIASSIFKGVDIQSFIVEQKKRITDLKIEKSEILNQNRYPVDYLELKYQCSKCKDTAYIGNLKCNCFKQKIINKYYAQSNLKDIVNKENFDTFDISFYSTVKNVSENISPRENMQEIFTHCISVAKNFDTIKESLFFYGNPGLGKTFLSNCIAKDLLDAGKVVIYQTSANLLETMRSLKFDEGVSKEQIEDLMNSDLLIIDDLGTEYSNAFSHAELFNIINTRILNGKNMIISTNYALNDFLSFYPERITSRIIGNFKMYKFIGDDIRTMKKR